MALEYRTTPSDDNFLTYMNSLGKENWIYCGEKGDKLIFYREVKKQVKSRALTTESNKSIQYLKMQRENIDLGKEIHYPDFVNDRKQWSDFINHWTQKNTEDGKMHCEKQKTFELRGRWSTFYKDKKEFTSNKNTIG